MGGSTVIGMLGGLAVRRIPHSMNDMILGFSAGVMLAAAVNGLILPISLGTMLCAAKSKKVVGDYKHPTWLFVLGLVVVAISAYVGIKALPGILNLFK